MRSVSLFVIGLVMLTTGTTAEGKTEGGEFTSEEQTFHAAGLTTDGPTLLRFFHARTKCAEDGERMIELARQLGGVKPEERTAAVTELLARGPVAIPALRWAVNNLDNPRQAELARRCLEWVEGSKRGELPQAAARLLAARRPHGTVETLLAYLPFADDAAVMDAVRSALGRLAKEDAAPAPALVQALKDPMPLRRVVALEALSQGGRAEAVPAAKELLNDPNPTVRLRAALALAEKQDADAVGVLIELLAVLPPVQRRQAEEVLQQLAGEWAPNPALTGEDEVSRRIRRDVWAAWWKHTDGPALLAAFRSQTLTPEDHGLVRGLIERLGHKSFAARELAASELVALGPKAVPLLRQAAQGKDLEIVRRAQACLTLIAENDVKLPLAAARLLALRRPSGAVEALLAYAPFAENEPMLEEIATALRGLAAPGGKPDAALVQALSDSVALRRGLAAEALAKANVADALPSVRKLLDDPDAGVRLRTALALVRANERQAVPALIRLMGEMPIDQAWPAEEMLFQLAGENPPQRVTDTDAQAGAKRQAAWEAWWKQHGESIDLAKVTPATTVYGYTLLVQVDPNNNGGRVVELGRDGKPRWTIEGLQFPVDAHMIGNTRVLIAEYNGRRVTERDLKGTIVWKKDNLPGSAVNVQRLRNGNTFIATENTLLEVNPAGTTVASHQVGGGITAAYRLPNGQTVCLTQRGTCLRLDANGKEVKSFSSGRGGGWTSGLDLLANGRILIAQPDRNSVAEYDLEGKQVWQVSAPSITTASRTPNGNTLVASFDGRRVYELDKTGKQVWEHRDNYSVFRARRR